MKYEGMWWNRWGSLRPPFDIQLYNIERRRCRIGNIRLKEVSLCIV